MSNPNDNGENKISSILDLIGEKEYRMLTLIGIFAALSMYLFGLSETVGGNERIYIGFGAVASLYLFVFLMVSTIHSLLSSAFKWWWRHEVEDAFTFGFEAILVVFALIFMLISFVSLAYLKFPLESVVYVYNLNIMFGIWLFFKLIMPLRQKSLGITGLIALATLFLAVYLIYWYLPPKSLGSAILYGITGAAGLVLLLTPAAYIHDWIKNRRSNKNQL